MKEEQIKKLKLLQSIKKQLLDKSELAIKPDNAYEILISANDWHGIFKTDEFNKMIKK